MKRSIFLASAMLTLVIGALASCEKPEEHTDTVDTTTQTAPVEDRNFVVRWEMFKNGPFMSGERPNIQGDYDIWMDSDTDWCIWRWTQYGEDSLMVFTIDCSCPSTPMTQVHPGYWPNHTYRYRIIGDSILWLYYNLDMSAADGYNIENTILEYTDSTISFIRTDALNQPTNVYSPRGDWCEDGTFCRIIHGDLWRDED